MMPPIQTIDFSLFLHGNDTQRHQTAAQLVDGFRSMGLVKLVNHGVSDETINTLLNQSRKFFSLPVEDKTKIANDSGPRPQRGWSSIGMEQTAKLRKENMDEAAGREVSDKKEHFDAGPPSDDRFPKKWPEALPKFQPLIENSYEICQQVCLQIMAAVEIGLGLPPGRLLGCCEPAASEIRLLYYPPLHKKRCSPGEGKRAWPHTDLGIITLLFQDTVGGLEIEDRNRSDGTSRTFIPVTQESSGEMVVNTSDSLQRWTNDVIQAGLHQVTTPSTTTQSDKDMLPERYSSVFFFKAGRDNSVGSLPEFVTEARPAKYKDMTALEYQEQKTRILHGVHC